MEWVGMNELREMFLAFFESKGHLRQESASLVPQGDASLLLINSGMAPLKKYFTGELAPPSVRMATCQKCIRTVDIENVGVTDRHASYFEMLGNFSFGDYFKREAIAWAWEFFTEVLKMDPGKLYPTVFLEDDEAWDIWAKEIGVSEDHLSRLGREDNFWEHGKGPCGPSSEIYYDRGAEHGCDCDRYMEVWNLVFTQFASDGEDNYARLEKCNIDTGMALERLGCVVQGVGNLFEVDTMQSIMKHISEIAGVAYHDSAKQDVSLRIITDHIRATVMMVGDGVMPSNEGRGYVLRRLLRRAIRHGKMLKIQRLFLSEVVETVIRENQSAYPQLNEKRDFILRVIATEEENFSRTIDAGMQMLNQMIESYKENGETELKAGSAFKLSDTYGFPIELTKEILAEHGMTVDEEGFHLLVQEQRERSRAARKEAGGWDSEGDIDAKDLPATEFVGYDTDACEATVLAVFDNIVVLDKTPFYAESGGQCGDSGSINCSLTGGQFPVANTTKTADGMILHHKFIGTIPDYILNHPDYKPMSLGELQMGDTVRAVVSDHHREDVQANHTAAHLLQAALRKVLGNHVEQAGQSVTPEHMRFDFTHFAALTKEELFSVEEAVNNIIRAALPVQTEILPIEEAKARGALALFGEKYDDTVRTVRIPGVSMELCGGTHAANTGNLGMFKILGKDSSIASGVRRITAVTATRAYKLVAKMSELLIHTAGELKIPNSEEEYKAGLQAVIEERKELKRENAQLKEKLSGYAVRELLQNAKAIGGVRLVSGMLQNAEGLRQACDIARQCGEDVVALFVAKTAKGTLQFAAACAPGAVKLGAHAGNLVKAAAQAAGGAGGGKPDSAMAGGKDPSKLKEALAAGEAALCAMLNAEY